MSPVSHTFCIVCRRLGRDVIDCSMFSCNRGSNNDDVNVKYNKINRTRGMSYVEFLIVLLSCINSFFSVLNTIERDKCGVTSQARKRSMIF